MSVSTHRLAERSNRLAVAATRNDAIGSPRAVTRKATSDTRLPVIVTIVLLITTPSRRTSAPRA